MMPSTTPPKPAETSNGVKLVWKLIARRQGAYLLAASALFASTVFQFLAPLISSATIDFILTENPARENRMLRALLDLMGGRDAVADRLWLPAAAIVIFAAIAGVFNYLQKRISAKTSDSICKRLKDQLYDHIQRLSNRYIDQAQTGDLVQRCTSDIETTRIFLSAHVVEIGRSFILVLTALPILLAMHVGLTIVSVALIPLIIYFSYAYTKRVKNSFQAVDEAEGRLTTAVQENITGIRVVRAFGRHDYETAKFAKPNREYRETNLSLMRHMSNFWSLSDLACLTQVGIALVASSYLALQGQVTIGTVFAFLAVLNMVLWPVRMIGRILTDFGKTTVALSRINEILDQPFETEGDAIEFRPEGALAGDIVFDDVSFAHGDGPPTVENISFSVAPGQTLAILGPSGSGKTTLMHLMLRFYDANSGTISVGGYDLKSLDRAFLRSQFGVVLQEPFLYSRTIRSNILFGGPSDRAIEVEEAARIASIHETIQRFKGGYETEIGERGITLSGGQRQRVALSRAILPQTPILLLDDALSAVDNETEAAIIKALEERRGNRTTIVIAHRLSTLAHADKIIVLEKGRITQTGTHDSLVAEPGLYQRLWRIQTQLEQSLQEEAQLETASSSPEQAPNF